MAATDLRVWAVKGAEQRLAEIAEEARAIFRAFPELRARGRGFDGRPADSRAESPRARRTARKRAPMSAAARKAVGARMKKYWADRRKSAAKPKG
jgi:hypothetical protein